MPIFATSLAAGLGPSLIGAGGSILGGILGGGSAARAGKASRLGAVLAAGQLQEGHRVSSRQLREGYETSAAEMQPYSQGGGAAWASLLEGLGIGGGSGDLIRPFTEEDFRVDPGYNFARQEGMRDIDRQGSARGSLLSGHTLKALQKFNQGLANQQYGEAWSRYGQEQDRAAKFLGGAAQMGQKGASNMANLHTSYSVNRANATNQAYAQQAALTQAFFGSVGTQAGRTANYTQNAIGGATSAFQAGLGSLFG